MRVSPSELYDVPTDVDDDGVWDIGFAECVKNIEPLAIDIAYDLFQYSPDGCRIALGALVELTVESRICPGMTSLLSGQYAFLLQGFDDSNRQGHGQCVELTRFRGHSPVLGHLASNAASS